MANQIQKWINRNILGIEPQANAIPETEERSTAISNTPGMMRLLNIDAAGVNVNDTTLESIPALTRAIDIVAGAIAKLPITVFRKKSGGGVEVLDQHTASLLCNIAPNIEQTPYAFWWGMVCNAFLSGGGGAEIIRREYDGKPIFLRLMRFGCTPYKIHTDDPLRYWDNETGKLFFPEDVVFLPGVFIRDGFQSKPLAIAFKNAFGEALAQSLLVNTLFKQGVYPSAVYGYNGTKAGVKGDEALALDISRYFGGLEKMGRVLPVPNMDKFYQLKPFSPQDAQMIESRKFSIAEISRITGVPADMLGETEKQSYSFSEQSAKNFTMYCLDPWITKRDQELRRKLLTTAEQGRVNIETHVDETLWMLPKDRAEYWNRLFHMGAKSPNEIRAYNNESPIEGGDEYYVQSQLIPMRLAEQFWQAKNPNKGTQEPPAARAKLNGHATAN